MNRRHFFGLTAAAVAALGLPELVLPERSIFLPPRTGWYPSALRMREVEQYLINTDQLAMRWDVLVSNGDGDHRQESVLGAPFDFPMLGRHAIDAQREVARKLIARRLAESPYARGKIVTHALKLPVGVRGAYV